MMEEKTEEKIDVGVKDTKEKCFVIMPISDPEGYEPGHFKKVYEQIFKPAIEEAGYYPHRVDENKASCSIQNEILRDLINAPMAICDLSTRNPNVLYELGVRQAFDKPVVLVQEIGTPRIFDISVIHTIDYRPKRFYDEVLEDQNSITAGIKSTQESSAYNSIISSMQIDKAEVKNKPISDSDKLDINIRELMTEVKDIKNQINLNSKFTFYMPQSLTGTPPNNRFSDITTNCFQEDKDYTYENLLKSIRNLDHKATRIMSGGYIMAPTELIEFHRKATEVNEIIKQSSLPSNQKSTLFAKMSNINHFVKNS